MRNLAGPSDKDDCRMNIEGLLFFFVVAFSFAAIVEIIHFIPLAKGITDREIYEKMFSVALVFLVSFLFFESAFFLEYFLDESALSKLPLMAAMGLVLAETAVVLRKNTTDLQITRATKEIVERSEKRYKNLIDTMNDGFWMIDEKHVTTQINQRVSEMLGYSEEEMLGKKVMDFVDSPSQATLKDHLEKRRRGMSTTYEVVFVQKNGGRLSTMVSASPLYDDKGSFAGSFAIITDITRRVELEKKIREYSYDLEEMVEERTKELTHAKDALAKMLDDLSESKKDLAQAYDDLKDMDRLKTYIISNISHELRTPITIAKSAIELIRDKPTPDERERFFSMCENALARLNDLVENLVEISSIYKGSYVASQRVIDIDSVVRDAIKEVKFMASQRDIKILFTPQETGSYVMADPKAVNRAVSSIIDNAIKFNRKGGRIEITTKRVGDYREIAFSDTGVGIPEKYRTKVFEPFYQVDPSTTRRFGGTGIGLALVKAHIEGQNGQVWVADNEGEGSTFYIKLPLAKEKDL